MNSRFRHASVLAAALAGAVMMATPALASPVVFFSGPSTVSPGGLLQLDVKAAGFTDLYAYQFDITFDPAAFSLSGLTEGSFLSTVGPTFFDGGQVDNTTGTVSFVLGGLIGPGSGATGDGALAQLAFIALPSFSGTASFAIDHFVALDSALNTLDASVLGTTVSAVPEPSALLLTLTALGVAGLATSARRARRPAPVQASA